ncbi:hypothetical protein CEUSTIGMA_g10516.t1 [Chlamydomonas eustigma]|uniref:Uncharacterized protein n=1 Tax=Chlamydomonas eustigma TaxID=1157962 RepID=A0A250XJW0_9CHLO|nr:hypothetical protein CEUSTIGMA_g10516.t1 [Chlamydomonas eustigma]|eukprot:GAX83090.1 hypothetical protein CEUSTIGMA_g10516.t1 [Chlamydomonas eustigma]
MHLQSGTKSNCGSLAPTAQTAVPADASGPDQQGTHMPSALTHQTQVWAIAFGSSLRKPKEVIRIEFCSAESAQPLTYAEVLTGPWLEPAAPPAAQAAHMRRMIRTLLLSYDSVPAWSEPASTNKFAILLRGPEGSYSDGSSHCVFIPKKDFLSSNLGRTTQVDIKLVISSPSSAPAIQMVGEEKPQQAVVVQEILPTMNKAKPSTSSFPSASSCWYQVGRAMRPLKKI